MSFGGAGVPGLVLRRQPVVRRVVERRRDDVDGPGRDERPGHQAADDLALGPGERDGEAVGDGAGRRRLGDEGGGDGEYVEAAVEGDSGPRGGGGLPEGDVGDGAGAGEDAEAHVLAAAEPGNGLDDVVPARDLQDVRAHSRLGVPGYDNGWLGLVLGARGAAPGPPHDLYGGSVAGLVGIGRGLVAAVRPLGRGSGGGAAAAAAGVIVFGGLAFS